MHVKTFRSKWKIIFMSELKNLKVSEEIHRRMKIEAAKRGVMIHDLTNACLIAALENPDTVTMILEKYMAQKGTSST